MDFATQLNKDQLEVVSDLEHNLLVNAPAGTGKTNALACRTSHIINSGRAAGDTILCLTFTNRACKELKKRIITMAGEDGLAVPVKTIHSFCYGLIREESKRAGLACDFLIYDDQDCRNLLQSIDMVHSFLQDNTYHLQSLCNFIEAVKKERIAYGKATEMSSYEDGVNALLHSSAAMDKICRRFDGSRDSNLEQWLATNGTLVVKKYDALLADNHGLDFSDLIIRATALLGQSDICYRWQSRYTYISIDEVQDTSAIEYALLSRLFPGRIILLCGDYFQTIYSWRGSDPDHILQQFKRDFQPRLITFTVNYRSTQTLLHASETCLTHLFSTSSQTLPVSTSYSPHQGNPIALHSADTFMDEGRWIFSQLQQLGPEKALKSCIMTRTNRCNKELWNSIRSHNETLPPEQRLPFTMADQFQLCKRQESKDVIAFLRLLLNKHDSLSLKRIVKRFADRIGQRTLDTIDSPSYRKLGITLADFVDKQCRQYGDPFGLLLENLKQGRIVVFDVEATGTDTTKDEIIQIAAIRLGPNGKATERFMTYIKARRPVGDSFYVHHISDEKLAEKGLPPQEALSQFLNFAQGCVIVGHNVIYDLTILHSELHRLGLPAPQNVAYYDTLDIYRRFYPLLENHTLAYLSKHFPVEHQPSHDAMDDILATAGILQYAVKENILPLTDKRRAAMAMYLRLFAPIAEQLDQLRLASYQIRPWQLMGTIMNDCGVKEYYLSHAKENDDAHHIDRIESIRQLYRMAVDRDDPAQDPRDALMDFLTMTSLSNSELDSLLAKHPKIPIITIHQAKGLEFDYVFLGCLQDGTFPLLLSQEKEKELSEEKRLFYVAMTRAKKALYLSWHKQEGQRHKQPSRFISAIPDEDMRSL